MSSSWQGSDLIEENPEKVAAALTVLDHINFKAIKLREFTDQRWKRADKAIEAPNITAMTHQFEARSKWVEAEVVIRSVRSQRSKALHFFISVAHECAALRNYFSVFSIMAGVLSAPQGLRFRSVSESCD